MPFIVPRGRVPGASAPRLRLVGLAIDAVNQSVPDKTLLYPRPTYRCGVTSQVRVVAIAAVAALALWVVFMLLMQHPVG